MKRMAKQCLVGLWVCTILSGIVQAQNENGGTARVSDQPGPLPPAADALPPVSSTTVADLPDGYFQVTPVDQVFTPRAYFNARAGQLYGYEESYTNVGAFLPYMIDDDAMVFVDGSGLVTYDGKGGANLGVGWRYFMPELQRVLGASLWYDFDGGHIRSYNQIGLSLESLGRYTDFRINGYIPIGQDHNVISSTLTTNMVFSGNRLLVQRANEVENAFSGFDAEVGGPMPLLGRYGLGGYAGFYFYTAQGAGDFTGVSGRLTWQLNEDASLGVQVTDDGDFGTNTQLQLSMWLPDGKHGRWLRPLDGHDRLAQRVIRNNRVTVEHAIEFENELGINPKDNQPYFVVFVDPNGPDGVAQGDGTAENPFNLLSQFDNLPFDVKSNVDIILVDPRTDNTCINLNEGVTLLSMQRLLGTSLPHTFQVAQQPGLDIPIFGINQTGSLAMLCNDSGGNVVTFADGAMMLEVSGFDIAGSATGSGIVGTNNMAVNINRNVIHDGVNGIQLFNLTGLATAVPMGMQSSITRNIIRDNAVDGIFIGNAGVGPLDLIIADNPPLDVDLDGVLVDTDSDGIPDSFQPDSLDGDGDFTNDGIVNNGDDGIDINADAGSSINLLLQANLIRGNGDNGVEIDATAFSLITGLITENSITGNQADGIHITADNSTLDFLNNGGAVTANDIRSNVGDGLEINTVESDVSFNITANFFGDPDLAGSGNEGFGLNYVADGGTGLMLIGGPDIADGNTFFGNLAGGICFDLSGDNLTTTNIENNTIVVSVAAGGNLIRTGFDQFALPAEDDFPSQLAQIGFLIDFFGVQFTDLFVNNNGNVTFNQALGTFTPFPIVNNGIPMIAPFFADVDTRLGNVVTYGSGTADGHNAFGVNWIDVRHFSVFSTNQGLPTNTFQLVLVDRSDIAPGDFDIEFNYQQILWEAGEASGSDPFGLGGFTARAGYTNGVNNSFELPGSGVPGALLDSGPATTSLVQNSLNSPVLGRYLFRARNGNVINQQSAIADQGGIKILTSDFAQLTNSTIQNNTITGQAGFGLTVATSDLSQVTNLLIQNNTINNNGGGVHFDRLGSSTIEAILLNNTMNQNTTNGLELTTDGLAFGGVTLTMQDNVMDGNDEDGFHIFAGGSTNIVIDSLRDQYINSGDDNIEISSVDSANITFTLLNPIITGAADNGIETVIGGTSVLNLTVTTVDDGVFVGTTTISGNGNAGFNIGTIESGFVTVNFDDVIFTQNGDGLAFNRDGSSLILATITNSQIIDNNDDGIDYTAFGSNVQDPATPLFNPNTGLAPVNRLTLNNVLINDNGFTGAPNGGNGVEAQTDFDANLVFNFTNVEINNNSTDGMRIFSGARSSFGNEFTGERSTFDAVTITANGRDGVKLFSMGQFSSKPNQLVEFNSNSGLTNISDNGDDGVEVTAIYTILSDVLITGSDGTFIQRNGGTGIEFNVADAPVDGDDASDIPGANVRVDGDGDGAANEIIDFYFPQGFEFDGPTTDAANGILTVQNVVVGDDDINDGVDNGNFLDGIGLFVSNIENFHGFHGDGAAPNAALGNQQDVNRDLIVDNSPGQGASILASTFVLLNQAGFLTATIDSSSMSGNGRDGLNILGDGQNSVFDTGNLINVTVTNNQIADNARHGVNIDLEGRHGETNALNVIFAFGADYTVLTTNQFIFSNNLIERNANYGFRYQANAGAIHRPNFDINPDGYFWGEAWQDLNVQPTNPPFEFDPDVYCQLGILQPIYNSSDLFGPNVDFSAFGLNDGFYSIATDLNSRLVFTNNIVQFNGTPGQQFDFGPNGGGDGMFIRNSTDSYLSADIGGAAGAGTGNFFSGNALADIRFESFTATTVDGITPMVPIAATAGNGTTQDRIFLDDTAQLTLRFNNNIGREVDANFIIVGNGITVGQRAAAYHTNGSPFIGGVNRLRLAQMFQVDDGFNLNTTNTFLNDLTLELNGSGGWHLAPVADPAFPDPIFPENCIQDPGSPWFPF